MRERGSIWPVISVAAGAFFVLVIVPLVMQRQKSGRMATVDPHVMIGDEIGAEALSRSGPSYRWPDSEVPRTAERLRDLTAVAIAATNNIIEGAMRGRIPGDTAAIVSNIVRLQLIPPEWVTNQPGVLQTTHGTIHLRYLPTALSVEAIAVPDERTDGPAMLIRLPDLENVEVGPRYFESMQLDGIAYPEPFAPIATIIASGWQPRNFKQTQIADDQKAQLIQWANTAAQAEQK